GGALVVRGGSGAGKTALLERAVAAADGMTVLRARGVAAETGITYASLFDVLRPVLGLVEHLPPLQAAVIRSAVALGRARPDSRLTVGVAVLGLLAAAAAERPVLVVLDDVQWIDEASAEALAFATRRVDGQRLAVLAATRQPAGIDVRFSEFDTLVLGPPDDAAAQAPRPATEAGPDAGTAPAGRGHSIRLLGGFEVEVGGHPVALPGLTKQLVAVLALRGTMAAEEVIEVLWPDVDPGQGQNRLRKVLWRVRQAGAEDLIVRRGNAMTLATGVVVDARRFRAAADAALAAASADDSRAADLARAAVALYSGELLPASRVVEWTAAPRESLRRQFVALLDLIAADAAGRLEHDEALAFLNRAIESDPYDEERYIRGAELLLAQDRRGPALLLLQQAEAMMESLGLPPSPSAAQLRHRLGSE